MGPGSYAREKLGLSPHLEAMAGNSVTSSQQGGGGSALLLTAQALPILRVAMNPANDMTQTQGRRAKVIRV